MSKADLSKATRVLTELFESIWDKETIPSDWAKGIIIKLTKKRNVQVCDKWQGITLLSIPSKFSLESFLEDSRQLLTKT